MGYRLYLGEVSKKEHKKMQAMSYADLCKKYGEFHANGDMIVGVYELVKMIYEFGKYYDPPRTKKIHFFTNKENREVFDEYDFWIVSKKFLKNIIEEERKFIEEWYSKKAEEREEVLRQQQREMATEWGAGEWIKSPYNLDINKSELVSSWKREYQVFDLVRIYKTFDFEKNFLIYYGW